jgi:hypothetical protein
MSGCNYIVPTATLIAPTVTTDDPNTASTVTTNAPPVTTMAGFNYIVPLPTVTIAALDCNYNMFLL